MVSTRKCEKNANSNYEMVPVMLKEKELHQSRELPIIRVKLEFNKVRRAYFTFMTDECAQVLAGYVREREMRAEELTPESYLVVNVKGKGRMNITTVERRWRGLLKRSS